MSGPRRASRVAGRNRSLLCHTPLVRWSDGGVAAVNHGILDPWLPNPRFVSVVDSDTLMPSVQNDCRKGPAWRGFLHQAATLGTSRLFASDHVYDEVYARLHRFVGPDAPLDVLLAHFETAYLPLLNFVTIPQNHPLTRHERVAAVTDLTDVPTAVLAMMVAPCAVFSNDHALRNAGFAPPEWRPVAGANLDVAKGDEILVGASAGVLLPSVGLGAIIKSVADHFEMSAWLLGLLVFGGGALCLSDAGRRHRFWNRVGPSFESTMQRLATAVERRDSGLSALEQATFQPCGNATLEQFLARQLATAKEPTLGTHLFRTIPEGLTAQRRDVFETLRGSPLFVQRSDDRWQLGRQRLPLNRGRT